MKCYSSRMKINCNWEFWKLRCYFTKWSNFLYNATDWGKTSLNCRTKRIGFWNGSTVYDKLKRIKRPQERCRENIEEKWGTVLTLTIIGKSGKWHPVEKTHGKSQAISAISSAVNAQKHIANTHRRRFRALTIGKSCWRQQNEQQAWDGMMSQQKTVSVTYELR